MKNKYNEVKRVSGVVCHLLGQQCYSENVVIGSKWPSVDWVELSSRQHLFDPAWICSCTCPRESGLLCAD